MYTKNDLIKNIQDIGILSTDTILIHSSMKAIGQVEGGAETVLDAFMAYLENGLMIMPTHTWAQIGENKPLYNPQTEPACVGLLPNLFMKREGVKRSLHPTHSLAAYGKKAEEFINGEELLDTPCPRNGCYGRLYDWKAKVLFLGCSLKHNTFLHGVEEWFGVPDRITDTYQALQIVLPSGEIMDRPMRRHYHPTVDISENYDKMEKPFFIKGIAHSGRIGDAESVISDAKGMCDLTTSFLMRDPDIFANSMPIPEDWYI